MIVELTILIVLLFLAALYAGSEIVFIVVNKLKIELKAHQGSFSAKTALNFLNNPKEFLIIALVGTNIFHIAFSSVFAIVVNKFFVIDPMYIMLLTAFILLLFSEIVPKVFFRENAEKFVYIFSIFLTISKILLSPIISIINTIVNKVIKLTKVSDTTERLPYSRDDLYQLIKSHDKVESENNEIYYFIKSLELMDKLVKDVMIPRTEITAVEKNIRVEELIKLFYETNNRLIWIYDENIDNIIGYVTIDNLMLNPEKIDDVISPVFYVPETLKCSELLEKFHIEKKFLSVVIDEFGGTAGIVSLKDLIKNIFYISDKTPTYQEIINKKVNDNTYVFNGRTELEFINEKYNLNFKSGEALTIGGYIVENIGRIPKTGEVIKIDPYVFIILKASKTKIEYVELKVNM